MILLTPKITRGLW